MNFLASLGLNVLGQGLKSPAVKALLVLIVAMAIAGYSARVGYNIAADKGEAAMATLKAEYAQAIADAAQAARRTEQNLRADIDAVQAKYQLLEEAAAREAAELATLVSDLRAGTRRLSIRVQSCAASGGGSADTASAGSGGSGGPQRAELDPATAESLIGIARDGDRYIRERNACIEAYEAVRRRLSN